MFRINVEDPDTGVASPWQPENSGDSYTYKIYHTYYGSDVDFSVPRLQGYEHFPKAEATAMYMMFRFQERPSGINGPVRNKSNPFAQTSGLYEAYCPEPED